jgi:hypothetical protein
MIITSGYLDISHMVYDVMAWYIRLMYDKFTVACADTVLFGDDGLHGSGDDLQSGGEHAGREDDDAQRLHARLPRRIPATRFMLQRSLSS